MSITHQDIIDRRAELDQQWLDAFRKARQAADAVVTKERESLRELCGGLGHVYAKVESASPLGIGSCPRYCVFCNAKEC